MAYSLAHTIPWVDAGTRHDALVYLFDTALATRSNTVVSPHPDSGSYKRSVKRTVNSWVTGTTHDMYYWVNWSNGTPTSCSIYRDATYTTTPGDLGTSTVLSISIDIDVSTSGGDFQFWTSDSSDGVLMTQNKTCLFWEPGVSEGMFYPDPDWDGTASDRSSGYFPYTNHDLMMIGMGGYPIANTLSGTDFNMNILFNNAVAGGRPAGYAEIITAPPVSFSDQTTVYYPDSSDTFAFFLPQDAIYTYPNGAAGSNRLWGTTSLSFAKVLFNSSNSRYYITWSTTGTGIDCGTTEPNLT